MTSPEEPWQWSETTWRAHVARVRAGIRLSPPWPDQARVCVALSFDSDHETIALRDNETRPGKLAQGEYGARVAVPRILDLLDRHGVPASFFVPAVSGLLHPGEVRDYASAGHEVAAHGWIHERNMLLEASNELDLTRRSLDVLESLSGQRPIGLRTPSWDFSDSTMEILRELELVYDSSLMADDDCYELLENGEPTGIVELPVEWIRDDAAYFVMDRYTSLRPYTRPRDVLEIWRDEFDAAYAAGSLFQLTMHPHIIGHRSRLPVLEELLSHIEGHQGVWFATHAQVARHVRQAAPDTGQERGIA